MPENLRDDSARFLEALYPELASPHQLVVWTLPDKVSHWLTRHEEAVRLAQRLRTYKDVYFGVALQDRDRALEIAGRRPGRVGGRAALPVAKVRGFEASAVALPGVWVDLDVAGGGHRDHALPPDRQSALGLLGAVPQSPSIIVASGGGLHVYWLFRELWHLENARERAAAAALVRKVQHAIRKAAETQGWHVDPTADLARVLRVPGTFNHKTSPPRPVRIEHLDPAARYTPADFDLLPEPPAISSTTRTRAAESRPHLPSLDDGPAADVDPVKEGCSWFRYCHEHADKLPEKDWYAALSIVGRCASDTADGRALAHAMSQPYPGYSEAETDAKLHQALTRASARTCASIARDLGAEAEHCSICPHRGIKSPILLGRQRGLTGSRATGSRATGPRTTDRRATPPGGSPPPPAHPQGSPPQGARPPERQEILITDRESHVCDQALAAVQANESNLFQRGGLLTQVAPGEDEREAGALLHRPPEGPRLHPLSEPGLREILARHCAFKIRKRSRQEVRLAPAHPPPWAMSELLSRPTWPGVPRIEGIVEGPALRADGSILQRPGYDRRSGLFCALGRRPFARVAAAPASGDVEEALIRLRQAVCDFPFAEEAHFAAWLAALLTPVARYAFRGPSPLFVVDANIRGAGKSLLVDVCHLIVNGRPAPRMTYTRDETEMRKAITTIALAGSQMVLIDNVSGVLASATLDLVLTGATWSDRLLGGNVRVELPLCATWYVTGNNLVLGEDTPRRALHIRLDSPEEKPEERSDFRHPELARWISAERYQLLPDALTLLAAYLAAGRPPQDLLPMGSYEGWSGLVRGTLVWLGLPDPALTRQALATTADSETDTLRLLVEGIEDVLKDLGGVATAKEILRELEREVSTFRYESLRGALEELFPRLDRNELPTPAKLGYKLRAVNGRVVGGAAIVQAPRSPQGARWMVRRGDSAALQGPAC